MSQIPDLFIFKGKKRTYQEISAMSGISVGTLRWRVKKKGLTIQEAVDGTGVRKNHTEGREADHVESWGHTTAEQRKTLMEFQRLCDNGHWQ